MKIFYPNVIAIFLCIACLVLDYTGHSSAFVDIVTYIFMFYYFICHISFYFGLKIVNSTIKESNFEAYSPNNPTEITNKDRSLYIDCNADTKKIRDDLYKLYSSKGSPLLFSAMMALYILPVPLYTIACLNLFIGLILLFSGIGFALQCNKLLKSLAATAAPNNKEGAL